MSASASAPASVFVEGACEGTLNSSEGKVQRGGGSCRANPRRQSFRQLLVLHHRPAPSALTPREPTEGHRVWEALLLRAPLWRLGRIQPLLKRRSQALGAPAALFIALVVGMVGGGAQTESPALDAKPHAAACARQVLGVPPRHLWLSEHAPLNRGRLGSTVSSVIARAVCRARHNMGSRLLVAQTLHDGRPRATADRLRDPALDKRAFAPDAVAPEAAVAQAAEAAHPVAALARR
mmetsp:Transcript_11115/g.26082  ORF Transcript_11115/g.26082 Transcript_11115/m.26082 type:complete len:236 (+) Transcript_11115:304-1011(+)